MSRRHLYVLLTLLPLLTLRALLPAGYMVAADGEGPRIVMCSDGLAASQSPSNDSRHDQLPAAGEECPFALAAMHAPPPHEVVRVFAPTLETLFFAQTSDELPPSTGPPRLSGARAPPALFL
jgi:hypothetical protein